MVKIAQGLARRSAGSAGPARLPDRGQPPRSAYILVIDPVRAIRVEALVAQIPGASFYPAPSCRTRPGEDRPQPLSERLEQVLHLVGQGLSNKAIGRRLGISHFTVRNHVARLMWLYGASSRADLAALIRTDGSAS